MECEIFGILLKPTSDHLPVLFCFFFQFAWLHLYRKCRRKIQQDCFAVVRSYGESTWTDSNKNKNSTFGTLYTHFEIKCLGKFDGDVCYRPTLSFQFPKINIDSKCKTQLIENEKEFLINLGITFWWSNFNLRIFFRYLLYLFSLSNFQASKVSVKLKRA